MSDTSIDVRTYRLSPVDRTGWLFGMSLVQLLIVAAGVIVGAVLMVVVSVIAGVAAMVVIVGLGAARLGGQPLVEMLPLGVRWARITTSGGSVWFEAMPVVGPDAGDPAPLALAGLELLRVDAAQLGLGPPGAQAAVSHDVASDTIAATLRVSGRQFGLLEPAEQDWLLDAWGPRPGGVRERTQPSRQYRLVTVGPPQQVLTSIVDGSASNSRPTPLMMSAAHMSGCCAKPVAKPRATKSS